MKNEELTILTLCGPGSIIPTITDRVSESFRKLGATVFDVRFSRLADIPNDDDIRRMRPDVLFTPDYLFARRRPDFFKSWNILHAAWWVDNPLYLGSLGCNSDDLFFTCDSEWIPLLRKLGADDAYCLPHCSDPDIMKPVVDKRFSCDVSFLGQPRLSTEIFEYIKPLQPTPKTLDFINRIMQELPESPGALPDSFIELDNPSFPWQTRYMIPLLLREAAASQARVQFCCDPLLNVHIYGPDDWKHFSTDNSTIHGKLHPDTEAPLLYANSKISLNFHAGQLFSGVNQRVFDVPAAGGFCLSDYRSDLPRLFGTDEVDWFINRAEYREKVSHWLRCEDERIEMASRAQDRVLAQHTFLHRAESMLDKIKEKLDARTKRK